MSFGKIKITDFGKRHFDSKFGGTKITDKTVEEFEKYINEWIENPDGWYAENFKIDGSKIIDGYAPFCKLIAIPNFTNAKVGSLPITLENYQYIRHGYSSRTKDELSVLSRWLEIPTPIPVAKYLIIVVYSKEQIDKEAMSDAAQGRKTFEALDSDWGVVAILGQTHSDEEPLQPITMMRNSLGIEEGGSGVVLDKEKYLKSVEFWSKTAIVKS